MQERIIYQDGREKAEDIQNGELTISINGQLKATHKWGKPTNKQKIKELKRFNEVWAFAVSIERRSALDVLKRYNKEE